MQAVCQLDDDDTDILGHREEHFAEILKLLVLFVLVVELGELRHAIDQEGDFFTKEHFEIFQRIAGILDDIMQECCHDAFLIHFQLRQNIGHGDGMDDVWLARLPGLSRMGFFCQLVGFFDEVERFLIMHVRFQLVEELFMLFFFFSGKILLLFHAFYIFILMDQKFGQRRSGGIRMDGLFIEIAIEYAWCWKGIRFYRYFCFFVFCIIHSGASLQHQN